jgi:hypothetical protein
MNSVPHSIYQLRCHITETFMHLPTKPQSGNPLQVYPENLMYKLKECARQYREGKLLLLLQE